MKDLIFNKSPEVSIGVELEFQIIDRETLALTSRANEVMNNIKEKNSKIKPELTQSMIEINSAIHYTIKELFKDLRQLYNFLSVLSSNLNIFFCGGGTHPFQPWNSQNIFKNFEDFAKKYSFLAKRATVFGQHIHIGCLNAEDALYLTHALTRYIPHFIAISASSPFYLGIDTGFDSSRSTVFNAFPFSGLIPFLTNWKDFSKYYNKMRKLKIIDNIDDIFWDVKPKPDFGTVEIRVCDTPLNLRKVILIAAYLQSLSLYLLEERPIKINQDLYFLYSYNRFQASRYGLNGNLIDSNNKKHRFIHSDILNTIKKIKKYTHKLENEKFIKLLIQDIKEYNTDAKNLRNVFKSTNSFQEVVLFQCEEWVKSTEIDYGIFC